MTSELRLQQNRLVAASHLIDERRALHRGGAVGRSGGGDRHRRATATHRSQSFRRRLISAALARRERTSVSRSDVLPELDAGFAEARAGHARMAQRQICSPAAAASASSTCASPWSRPIAPTQAYVVTLDDITDLVTAQRTSAWADVARRIAHEIKNPLTPIQLSAERLKRKYGSVIIARPRYFRPMHRHDHPPGRRHQAHGRRILVLRAHAEGATVAGRSRRMRASRSCS